MRSRETKDSCPVGLIVPFKDTINTSALSSQSMALEVDTGLLTLFGSETRVRTLATLASASEPLTAYRIAQMVGVQRTKIYGELRRLDAAGIVRGRPTGKGRSDWELIDPDIRRLLRRRARIVSVDDLAAGASRLARSTREILKARRKNPIATRLLGDPRTIRNPEDFARPPEKDQVLASLGLRTSRHTKRRR